MGDQRRRTRTRRAAAGRNQTAVPGDLGRAEKLLRGLVAIKCCLVTLLLDPCHRVTISKLRRYSTRNRRASPCGTFASVLEHGKENNFFLCVEGVLGLRGCFVPLFFLTLIISNIWIYA
jgi:hypothetical protein